MLRNLIILVLFLPFSIIGQNKVLTYDQTQDIVFAEQYNTKGVLETYITKEGISISIGDTLTIGNALIKRKNYLFNDVFSHIAVGNTKGVKNREFRYLPHRYSGSKVIVKSFYVKHERFDGYKLWPNRKRIPLYVAVFVKNPKSKGLAKIFLRSRKTILDIEKAFLCGEIIE